MYLAYVPCVKKKYQLSFIYLRINKKIDTHTHHTMLPPPNNR